MGTVEGASGRKEERQSDGFGGRLLVPVTDAGHQLRGANLSFSYQWLLTPAGCIALILLSPDTVSHEV